MTYRTPIERLNDNFDMPLANSYAKRSTLEKNKSRFSRRCSRHKYWKMAEIYYSSEAASARSAHYLSGEHHINTYPLPYRSRKFAPWLERTDIVSDRNLVVDQSGFVIRHSTSYCAWKIAEAMDFRWPKKSKKIFHAKNWVGFLYAVGFPTVLDVGVIPSPNRNYVGIDRTRGEYGLVVWFEGLSGCYPGCVEVSTYLDHKYKFFVDDWTKYIWVEISPYAPKPFRYSTAPSLVFSP